MSLRSTFLAVLVAVGLTAVFWGPLWRGGGLIGGDTYTYYLPQKTFYADRLHAGEFPLWNNRVGHGYPILGESQTGACYPFYPLAYAALDVNAAYNAVHLLHYALAFVSTWMYSRRIGLRTAAALLAALVFTYGWFPSRVCWEWAIVTGAYLPLALWCVESFLQTAWWRYLIALSAALGLQLLAGHYNLAFITHLVLLAYVPLRLWFAGDRLAEAVSRRKAASAALCGAALFVGFALAAVQLLPTWELKRQSQRAAAGGPEARSTGTGYDPAYGHLPPLYLTQLAMPWDWYPLAATGELDGVLNRLQTGSIDSGTNQVEAHLYFGLAPLLLIVLGFGWWMMSQRSEVRGQATDIPTADGLRPVGPAARLLASWALLGIAAIVYATGWLVPVTRHLPGFSFFTGPGRFGIVATLAAAIVAAAVLDRLLSAIAQRRSGRACETRRRAAAWVCFTHPTRLLAAAIVVTVFAVTVYDLHRVSRLVTNAYLVERPPIQSRADSRIARLLQADDQPPRLFAPGANLATLTGAAATPVYLGIGPAAYFDESLRMPALPPPEDDKAPLKAADGQVEWLQRAGVTHVLSFQPLDSGDWPAELMFAGPDAMLHTAWNRPPRQPLFLYRLNQTRGRVAFAGEAAVSEYAANRVVVEAESTSGGRLILTDLMYPGWNVRVDGQPAEPITHERMFRAVDLPPGRHTVVWSYRPARVYWGAAISLVALILLAAVAHVRYWRLPSEADPRSGTV